MKINIENQSLPIIYRRNGKDCYLDPVRKKLMLMMAIPVQIWRDQRCRDFSEW